jgi:NitT/TauT family transport system substrate-binding protein
MKKFFITVIICIIVIALVVTGVILKNKNNNTNTDVTTVSVNEVTRSVFYAPQYVAIANGYFEEEGIKIELTPGQGADTVMTAVVSNQCDIGFAGPEVAIYVYNEGKEDYCQVFAQLTKKDGSFLVSRTNDTDFKWTDLKGKTIIPGRKGGVPYMTLEYVLRKNGLNPETDVVLDDSIKFDLMAGAFTGGTADYVTLFEPTATMTEQAGKGYIVASVGEEAGEIPYTAYFAKKSYIEQNSDVIQAFTNAIYKGQKWVKEHTSEEIAEVIQSFFPDTEVDLLANAIQSYIDIDAWNDNPILKEESFERLQEVMEEAGELTKKAPYGDIVNNSYAESAIKN